MSVTLHDEIVAILADSRADGLTTAQIAELVNIRGIITSAMGRR